jgi:hypothetical protein
MSTFAVLCRLPLTRKNVRRERCFFEMKFIVPVSLWAPQFYTQQPT